MKKGIDLSSWQSPSAIDYDVLADNISFAIIRAGFTGHGTGESLHADNAFDRHYQELTVRGVPVGAYWYSCATTPALAVREAQEFLRLIQGKKFEYPVYVDIEDEYHQAKARPKTLTDAMIAFGNTMEDAGYYFGFYTTQYWLYNHLESVRLTRFDMWVAHWSEVENPLPGRAGVWQYTGHGIISGYNGVMDLNYSYKDYPAIMRSNGLNGFNNPGKKYKLTLERTFDYFPENELKDFEALYFSGKITEVK